MKLQVTIYLIHAEVRHGHAGHYLGITQRDSLLPRLEEHLTGRGNTLVQLYADAIGINTAEDVLRRLVVATWQGTRGEERRMKNRGSLARVCPTCRAAKGLGPYIPKHMKGQLNGAA